MVDEVVFRKEALGSCVIASGEVDLSKPECVIGIPWRKSACHLDIHLGMLTCESK